MSRRQLPPEQSNQEQSEPPASNHVIWGMTAGLLLGTALGFLVFDQVAIGVAIGIGIGAALAMFLKGRTP